MLYEFLSYKRKMLDEENTKDFNKSQKAQSFFRKLTFVSFS